MVPDGLQFSVFHKLLMDWDFFSISRVHRVWFQKEKISKELQLCGGKPLVDVRGLNGRLAGDHRKETVAQITTA